MKGEVMTIEMDGLLLFYYMGEEIPFAVVP